jgi:hypothetical protein
MAFLQASTPSPTPAPPPAPPAPGTPVAVSVGDQVIGLESRPTTRAEYNALRERRSSLSNQLESVQERRDELVSELRKSPEGVARKGVEDRIRQLDERIMRLEQDIEANSRAIANAPLSLSASAGREPSLPPGTLSSGQITAISIVGTLAVGMPLAIAAGRTLMRRASTPKPSPQLLEGAARLERMEQSIDAMAVEIERISEGQRFVTQLMAGKEQRELSPSSIDRR